MRRPLRSANLRRPSQPADKQRSLGGVRSLTPFSLCLSLSVCLSLSLCLSLSVCLSLLLVFDTFIHVSFVLAKANSRPLVSAVRELRTPVLDPSPLFSSVCRR